MFRVRQHQHAKSNTSLHCAVSSVATCAKGERGSSGSVKYGKDWYKQTKAPRRTVRDEVGTQ